MMGLANYAMRMRELWELEELARFYPGTRGWIRLYNECRVRNGLPEEKVEPCQW
jgi:hypothetical protein